MDPTPAPDFAAALERSRLSDLARKEAEAAWREEQAPAVAALAAAVAPLSVWFKPGRERIVVVGSSRVRDQVQIHSNGSPTFLEEALSLPGTARWIDGMTREHEEAVRAEERARTTSRPSILAAAEAGARAISLEALLGAFGWALLWWGDAHALYGSAIAAALALAVAALYGVLRR